MRSDAGWRSALPLCALGCLWLGTATLVGLLPVAHAQSAPGPVELDRIVSRVHGRIITQSDVRQARAARLVDDVSSDAAARRALENRWLILAEIARAAPLAPPTDDEFATRRSEWQTSGPQSSMPESEIQAWLRDDLRIRAYLARQFGMLPPAERDRAREEWILRLRQRAALD